MRIYFRGAKSGSYADILYLVQSNDAQTARYGYCLMPSELMTFPKVMVA